MLAERPRKPEIVKGEFKHQVFYFIPDEISFGRWSNLADAEKALKVWPEYSSKHPGNWRIYCQSVGFQSVNFL